MNKEDELEVVLYSGIVRDKEKKTRQFLDLVELFWGKDDFLIINVSTLYRDSKISEGSKKMFNNVVFFLQQTKDHLLINWLEDIVGIRSDETIDFT